MTHYGFRCEVRRAGILRIAWLWDQPTRQTWVNATPKGVCAGTDPSHCMTTDEAAGLARVLLLAADVSRQLASGVAVGDVVYRTEDK